MHSEEDVMHWFFAVGRGCSACLSSPWKRGLSKGMAVIGAIGRVTLELQQMISAGV